VEENDHRILEICIQRIIFQPKLDITNGVGITCSIEDVGSLSTENFIQTWFDLLHH